MDRKSQITLCWRNTPVVDVSRHIHSYSVGTLLKGTHPGVVQTFPLLAGNRAMNSSPSSVYPENRSARIFLRRTNVGTSRNWGIGQWAGGSSWPWTRLSYPWTRRAIYRTLQSFGSTSTWLLTFKDVGIQLMYSRYFFTPPSRTIIRLVL